MKKWIALAMIMGLIIGFSGNVQAQEDVSAMPALEEEVMVEDGSMEVVESESVEVIEEAEEISGEEDSLE